MAKECARPPQRTRYWRLTYLTVGYSDKAFSSSAETMNGGRCEGIPVRKDPDGPEEFQQGCPGPGRRWYEEGVLHHRPRDGSTLSLG